jgi:biopolymer transport protein ExbB
MHLLKLLRAPALALAVLGASLGLPPAWAQGQASAPALGSTPAPASAVSFAAPAERPALSAPELKKEEVENPYGLAALWNQGDFVARGTLIAMILMSMGSWYILITKLLDQQSLFKQAKEAGDDFWRAPSVAQAAAGLSAGSVFRGLAEQGLKAAQHHEGTLVENIDLHTWISMSVQRGVDGIQSRLQGGLAFLATVGSTAPFVGLFGTVWGIYHALTAIGISGQASIDKVAGPVGEALIMTAFGLGVAVPAVMGYNWLTRRNKLAMEQVRNFAGDLHNVLLAGKK